MWNTSHTTATAAAKKSESRETAAYRKRWILFCCRDASGRLGRAKLLFFFRPAVRARLYGYARSPITPINYRRIIGIIIVLKTRKDRVRNPTDPSRLRCRSYPRRISQRKKKKRIYARIKKKKLITTY